MDRENLLRVHEVFVWLDAELEAWPREWLVRSDGNSGDWSVIHGPAPVPFPLFL